jgi:hypothetical protein
MHEPGKWPDDVEAIRKLSAALYLCMANCLNGSGASLDPDDAARHLMFTAKAFPDHLQVAP